MPKIISGSTQALRCGPKMLVIAFLICSLGSALAATDYCNYYYGGKCSYSQCSRYYVPSSQFSLCPSPYQRCCYPELCLTRFNGNCQNSLSPCVGAKYTHYGTSTLCQSSSDVCCIAAAPTVTKAPPTNTGSTEKCASIGGTCQVQTNYCNGQYKLLSSKSEVLCSNWYTKNERCCVKGTSVVTPSPRPTPSPATNQCGVQKVSLKNKRIIGGKNAEKGEWPWQVSIIKSASYGGSSFSHTCGGTLIAPQWVVSAAHCFRDVTSYYTLRVRIGEHSFYVNEGTEADSQVIDIIQHPQYNSALSSNDISLIKLSKPVDMNSKYINTACMPSIGDLTDFYNTQSCYTTGWGRTRGTGATGDSNILQEVQSNLVDQRTCYSKWGTKIDSTKVCFGDGTKGACLGDSGGPLVCEKNNLFYLVGVVSYGSQSCVDRYVPTVYTNVASYSSWIQQTIAQR